MLRLLGAAVVRGIQKIATAPILTICTTRFVLHAGMSVNQVRTFTSGMYRTTKKKALSTAGFRSKIKKDGLCM